MVFIAVEYLGVEPDVLVMYNKCAIFYWDFASESALDCRSICYQLTLLAKREYKPSRSDLARQMILNWNWW